ncbi:MAG TPA: type 4a pilus biogenesis protein PilO [bacterium]
MAANINIDVIMKRPLEQKILILAGALVSVFLLYLWLGYLPKTKDLSNVEKQLSTHEAKLNQLKAIAGDLPRFKEEVEKLEKRLQEALVRLPNKSEIPTFLLDISNQGKEVGLQFNLFKPKGESSKGLYAEVPVEVKVNGTYHEIGTFFDRLSRLPRIVNVRDITLGGLKDIGGRWVLESAFTTVTFRFIEDTEQAKGVDKSGIQRK